MARQRLVSIVVLTGLLLPVSRTFAGTVLDSYKYAWSNNVGYINFENVVVSDSALSGYAWSANAGWIKFNPAQGGVSNDGAGNLSGSAWGASLGWIDFSNVSIDPATGRFSGTATGSLVGTITFDCPNYCDVRTDWRHTAVSPVVLSVKGGRTPASSASVSEPEHVTSYDAPLAILPEQSGSVTQDTAAGQVVLEVPAGNVPNKTTFTITGESAGQTSWYVPLDTMELVNNTLYTVSAKDKDGNAVYFFPRPITITLPVPVSLVGAKGLAVYWINETNRQWVLVPDAVFVDMHATFTVNHLTTFAIFKPKETISPVTAQSASSLAIPLDTRQVGSNGTTTGEQKSEQSKVGKTEQATSSGAVSEKAPKQKTIDRIIIFMSAASLVVLSSVLAAVFLKKK